MSVKSLAGADLPRGGSPNLEANDYSLITIHLDLLRKRIYVDLDVASL